MTVYRTDTLRMMGRVDTITRTNTVTTFAWTPSFSSARAPARIGGMYFGLGSGPNLPFGAIRTVNEPGIVGQVNLGWQGMNSPLGIRLDGTVTQYAHNADYAFLGDKPMVYERQPRPAPEHADLQRLPGQRVQMTPYVIGGGSFLYYKIFAWSSTSPPGNGIPATVRRHRRQPDQRASRLNDSY